MALPNLLKNDPWLMPYKSVIVRRGRLYAERKKQLLGTQHKCLYDFACGHQYYGAFQEGETVLFREYLPHATAVYLMGEFSNWQAQEAYRFKRRQNDWELRVEGLLHGEKYKLKVCWDGGEGERIPAWATRVVQDKDSLVFDAQLWFPEDYKWQHAVPETREAPLIYEAHVGMASEEGRVAGFAEFTEYILPKIKALGYNTIQLMAIQEHPYYGSFGYHVSSFFAVSSRFGTPEELKALVDAAHALKMRVIMDVVHSHAVKNEVEGLGLYDGSRELFFHAGGKGLHPAWDSYCFNYGKTEVLQFLLSNIRYWLEEFRFDGFRFDGVTSMLYHDHGLERDFNSYAHYFDGEQDEEAIVYLMLANELMKECGKHTLSIAEEMSGYPGLAHSLKEGGVGFDYRLAMGVPDFWIKLLKEQKDEEWELGRLFYELSSKRQEERTISYAESHDQALVGDKTLAFRLMDKEMYFHMLVDDHNLVIDRGLALHKMIRLVTLVTAGGGYLNFMGNEFGHPEWIDFPREGNNWSYHYARRQWSLAERDDLKYKFLRYFDQQMVGLAARSKLLEIFPIHQQLCQETDRVLAISRSHFVFVFNFNATQSFTAYKVPVPEGRYRYVFSSDEPENGGYGRIDSNQSYNTILTTADGKEQHLQLYLPARTALVLEKIPIPNVYARLKKK